MVRSLGGHNVFISTTVRNGLQTCAKSAHCIVGVPFLPSLKQLSSEPRRYQSSYNYLPSGLEGLLA